jgi:hypothetical protein
MCLLMTPAVVLALCMQRNQHMQHAIKCLNMTEAHEELAYSQLGRKDMDES